MHVKIRLAGIAGLAALLLILGLGCASSSVEQSKPTSYMQSKVGTPEELSPLAPVGGCNVHKVGNQWTCELNSRVLVYNNATSQWEPQAPAGQK